MNIGMAGQGGEKGGIEFRTKQSATDKLEMLIGDGVRVGNPTAGTAHSGSVNVENNYYVDGFRVVTNRQVGWGTMTGAASKASLNFNTCDLRELAKVVKALLDDLMPTTGHGLIGPTPPP